VQRRVCLEDCYYKLCLKGNEFFCIDAIMETKSVCRSVLYINDSTICRFTTYPIKILKPFIPLYVSTVIHHVFFCIIRWNSE